MDQHIYHIVDYESKWIEDSTTYTHSHGKSPADIDIEILDRMKLIRQKSI